MGHHIIPWLIKFWKNCHLDVSILKLDNYFQASHKHLDYRSNENASHVSLIQDILFGVELKSYSRQQIHLEDAASQIRDSCITIPVSHKNIYRLNSDFMASTYVSLVPHWPWTQILYNDSMCL